MTDTLARQQQREDTAADWASVDPVLRAGELAWESDTGKLKIGDGSNPYTALDYWYGTVADILNIVAGTVAATTISAATAVTPDSAASGVYRYAITGSGSISSMTLTGGGTRPSLVLMVKRTASQTVTWDSTIDFAYGVTPTIPASGWLTLALFYDDSTSRWVERYRSPDAAVPATTSRAGVVPLGTDADAIAGTSTTVAVVPHALAAAITARVATHSTAGIVPLATTAETLTGTDDSKATTPVDVKAACDAFKTAILGGVAPPYDTLQGLRTAMVTDETAATALATLVGTIRAMTDASAVAAVRALIAGDVLDGTSTIGAELLLALAPKITRPTTGSNDGDSLLTAGGVDYYGKPNGTLTLNPDGTAHSTLSTGSTSSEATVEPGGGFSNCYAIADPIRYPAAQGQLAGFHFIGGDVYGSYLSADSGDTWLGQNAGMFDIKHFKTISIEFARAAGDVNKVGKLTSNWNGGNVGSVTTCFWVSTIDPTSKRLATPWSLAVTLPSTYRAQGDGATHPRQTGRMVVPHPLVAGLWFVALEGGVGLVNVTAGTFTPLALTGAGSPNVCSAIDIDAVKDPTTGIDLYVTVRAGTNIGVWKVALGGTDPHAPTVTTTQVTGTGTAPSHPENLRCVKESGVNVLYIADGLGGNMFTYTAGAWSTLTTGLDSTIVCKGFDAIRNSADTATTIIVSHDGPDRPNLSKTAWSTNSGSTWTLNLDTDSDDTLPNGQTWWLVTMPSANGNWRYYRMEKTGAGWDCPDARIDPAAPGTWVLVGRSSPWRRRTTDTTPKWHPICVGIAATVMWGIAAHPTIPGGWASADGDWATTQGVIGSQPRGNVKASGANPLVIQVTSRAAKFDRTGILYIGQSNDKTHDAGKLWLTGTNGSAPIPDVLGTDNFYEVLDSAGQTLAQHMGIGGTPDFGIRGLIVSRDPSDDGILLVPLIGPQWSTGSSTVTGLQAHAGIWRLKCNSSGVPTSVWTRVNDAGSLADNNMPKFRGDYARTATDAGNMYMYDPTTSGIVGGAGGLYRSLAGGAGGPGATWARIWPKLQAGNMKYASSVKCDPLVPNRVIVTIGTSSNLSKVYRIDNAHDGTLNANGTTASGTIACTDITGTLDAAGAVRYDSQGNLYVHQCASGANPLTVGFYKITNAQLTAATVASPPPWVNFAGARAQGQALFVTDMDISFDDRYLYASSDGMAAMVHDFGGPATGSVDFYTKAQVDALIAATTLGVTLTDLNAVTGTADGDMLEYLTGHWVKRTRPQVASDLARVSRVGNLLAVTLTPSATAGTDGTPVTYTLHGGAVGLFVTRYFSSFTGIVAGEQLTITFTVTFEDAATKTATLLSATGANTTQNDTAVGIQNFYRDGHYITGIVAKVKSSINGTAATATPTLLGLDI